MYDERVYSDFSEQGDQRQYQSPPTGGRALRRLASADVGFIRRYSLIRVRNRSNNSLYKMTRLNYETDHVSIDNLVNENLSEGDVIAIRTVGDIDGIEEGYLLTGRFATQPREHIVSDNFPFAAIGLKEMWDMDSGAATSLDSFPEECILHPHWSGAVKVRVGYENESAESYRTIGVVSDFEAGDIATPQYLLTEGETIC